MADLKFTVDLDIRKAESQLNKLMNKKLSLGGDSGATAGGAKESKGAKKSNNLLSGIMKGLAPLAVLLALKPVADLLKTILNFFMLGVLQIMKGSSELKDKLMQLKETLVEKLISLKEKLVEKLVGLKDKLIEKFIELKEKLIEKLLELKEKLIEKLLELKEKLVNKFLELKEKLVEKLLELKEKLIEKLMELKEKLIDKFMELKEKLLELKDKLIEKFIELKEKIIELKDKLIEKLIGLWDSIKELPQLIWDKVKQLASMIASKIKGAISSMNPFKSKSNRVNDAIIKPDGTVVKTHPNDTIIATKNPSGLGGGGKVFNFYGVTPQQMIDEVKRQLATEVNSISRF